MRRATCIALAFPLALSLALSLAACSGASPSTETPGSGAADFTPTVPHGTTVFVNRQGQWLPATVVQHTGPTTVTVHYEGMPTEWDEDVQFERVRSRPAPPGAAAAATDFKANETVLVKNQNRLLLAEVVQQLDAGTFRVHYAGYGPEMVENVPTARIQRPFTGATANPAGTAVLVEVGGPQPMPGKVVAVIAAEQWIVRLDGAGPQYDQQVGPDRIRPAAAALPAPTATAPAATTTAPATTAPKPAATAPKPATPAPVIPTPAAPVPLKTGDAVLLLVRSVYYPATVVGAGAATGTLKVRVEGQSADEEAALDRLVRLQDPLKGVKYQIGQQVFIEWHGVYAPGKVIKEAGAGNYKVRVDGKGAEADEIIPISRLRPRS